eukprot:TRINITY_DN2821_c0_g1_i3.p1 TRINITY_DN2821_c0_g1~~TRINITY_DN2821_c0_g1_i3.p1  ORF type:complete len:343 (-),score=71.86 TRINITY_DN2821_c0_g1_i3:240-1268(-)
MASGGALFWTGDEPEEQEAPRRDSGYNQSPSAPRAPRSAPREQLSGVKGHGLPADVWARVAIAAGLNPFLCLCSTGRANALLARPALDHMRFWSKLMKMARAKQTDENAEIIRRAEEVAKGLPRSNLCVQALLLEATSRLKEATDMAFKQEMEAERLSLHNITAGSEIASGQASGLNAETLERFLESSKGAESSLKAMEKIAKDDDEDAYSDASGDSFKSADYEDDEKKEAARQARAQLTKEEVQKQRREEVMKRHEHMIPLLMRIQQTQPLLFENCRLATKAAQDVRKYDFVNRDAKTPKEATSVAEELIEASGVIRKRFQTFLVTFVTSMAEDCQNSMQD